MFPSDALRVASQTGTELVIWDPPSYSFAGVMFIVAGINALVVIATLIFSWPRVLIVPFALFAIGMGLFGFYLWTSQYFTTLSKEKGVLEIMHYSFGKSRGGYDYPLANISQIVVETVQYSRVLTVVLKTGETSWLGDGSNRDGYYHVAKAMNDFLQGKPPSDSKS